MNGALLLLGGIVWFILAYFLYGGVLKRVFNIDLQRQTPAHTKKDGVDYVPTHWPVLFGHHFASIAGAGPIVGPVLAAYLGWGAVALWILLGCVLIGAVHDFSSLFLSVRNEGRSIGHVVENHLGYAGRQIFLLFCWAALVLVVAIFAILVAKTFEKIPSVATASLVFIVISPCFGFLVYRKHVSILTGTLIFVPLLFAGIWLGNWMPFNVFESYFKLTPVQIRYVWLGVIFVYVFIASVLPVWTLLQPRDYLNSFLLIVMMLVGFLGIMVAMPAMHLPAFAGWTATTHKGTPGVLFPMLFVTVACGACSGFHSLVASGTTSKQISSEKHILPVGYGAMLLEGLLALMALISVAYLSSDKYYEIVKNPVAAFAGGMAFFTSRLGISAELGNTFMSMTIAAFMLTTLDTATRLTRFTWQELFLPKASSGGDNESKDSPPVIANSYVATSIAVVIAGILAYTEKAWAIWPVFGASNQLLAALALLAVTLYLIRKKANFLIALVPMIFMICVSGWALVVLFMKNLKKNLELVFATAFLLVLAVALVVLTVKSLCSPSLLTKENP